MSFLYSFIYSKRYHSLTIKNSRKYKAERDLPSLAQHRKVTGLSDINKQARCALGHSDQVGDAGFSVTSGDVTDTEAYCNEEVGWFYGSWCLVCLHYQSGWHVLTILYQMTYMVCCMVFFGCNHHQNCLQLLNALTMLLSGAYNRVNDYLNFICLTSSRDTALQAFDTLQKKTEIKISKKKKLRPPHPAIPVRW